MSGLNFWVNWISRACRIVILCERGVGCGKNEKGKGSEWIEGGEIWGIPIFEHDEDVLG